MSRYWFPVEVSFGKVYLYVAWRGWRRYPKVTLQAMEGLAESAYDLLAMPAVQPVKVRWSPAAIVAALAVGFALGQWFGYKPPKVEVSVPFDVTLVQPKPPEVSIRQRGGYALPPAIPKENQ